MENFLKGLKSIGAKAKDLVTLTEKEKKEGKKANVAEKVTSTVGDWFAPSAKKNADGTFTPEVRVRDFAREVPGAVGNVAKEVAKGFARFGLSAGESLGSVPLGINELINPSTKYKVPIYEPEKIPGLGFLGPIESYQNQVRRETTSGKNAGVSTLKAVGNVALDEPLGVALKPLGLAMGAFVKSGGGKAIQETIENIAKTADAGEIKAFLKNLGIGKRAIDDLAEPLTKANTVDEVKAVLGYTDNVTPKVGKEAVEGVSRETETLYHGTEPDAYKSIMDGGFKVGDFEGHAFPQGVYFSTTKEAKNYGKVIKADTGIPKSEMFDMSGKIKKGADVQEEVATAIRKEAEKKGIKIQEPTADQIRAYEDTIGPYNDPLQLASVKSKALKDMGYKGFVVDQLDGGKEIVIFDPKDINIKKTTKAAVEPKKEYVYYHATPKSSADKIVADGFNTKDVYAFDDPMAARMYAVSKGGGKPGKTGVARNLGEDWDVIEVRSSKPLARKDGEILPFKKDDIISASRPESENTMRSIGDILKGGDVPPTRPVAEAKVPKGDPERRFVTRAREMAPQMDQFLDGKYSRRSTQELADNAEKLIKENETVAENLARTGTDDQAVAVASRLIDDLVTKARSAKGVEKDALYEKAAQIANDAARNLTEAGRAVQAASLLGRMTPEGMVRYAARQIQKYNEKAGERTVRNFLGMAKKVPELTADQAKRITDEMTRINGITDPLQKAREMQMFENEVKSLIPSSVYDKVIAFWKAGLLTGLKTTGVNVGSNIAHTVSEIAKDVPAAMVDKVVSLFTGKRTLSATTKGSYKGTAEGVAKGWDYFKTGFDERNIGSKLDYSKVNFGKGPVAKASQKYVDTVFGMLGAQDQPFYYGAKARSLYSQAIAAAKNEGLKGKQAKEFVEKLVANPTDDMLKYAHLDAETAVFQQDSWLASKAKSLQKGLEIILPFAKTPANVANAMINYSPVGIVKTIIENAGKGRFDQRLFAQGMGRGITGTGALAIGGALMTNKLMNLSFPTSEKERQQWELEGRIPNSIKIGDKWRNVGVLGPLGMVLIVGGHLRQGLEKTGSLFGGMAQAAGGFGNALTEQSFLSGINRAIDALKDPTRSFNGFASSLAGSVIPTIVADAARATDEYERRTDGPMDRLQSRVPGLRRGLEPQVDALGNIRETPNLFEVMADPTRPGNPSAPNDPVTIELRRLLDAGYNATPSELGDRNGYESLTPEENTKMWRLAGTYARKDIQDIMTQKSYEKYDDEQKAKLIDKMIQEGRNQARARIVLEAVSKLPETERKSKLADMKEDGLLTKTVYQIYQSLSRKK